MKNDSREWSTVSPSDLARLISHRLPSIIVTTVAVVIFVVGLLLVWPNRYASDGLFYARLGRGAVSIDPTTEPSRSVSLQDSRSSEVASISQMLNSRELADRVVKKVGAREINFPRTWTERAGETVATFLQSMSSGPDLGDSQMDRTQYDRQLSHEEAVKSVVNAITITVPKNSYTVSVSATCSDPLLSQKLVQAIMDEYGAFHVEAHNSTGSLDFFEQQTTTSHLAAIEAKKTLQSTKSEMGWLSSDSAEKSLRERILNLELSLDQINGEYAEAESKAESLSKRLKTIDEWIPMEITRVADNAVDGMKTQLYGYKLQDGEELSKVTASHPRYKILRDKIIQGEDIVNAASDDREQTVEARNPLFLSLETDYQKALTTAAGHRSRRESLVKSLASARNELSRLNQDAVRLAELSWAADIAEKNYLSHSQSLESSRMMQELDNEKMSDVSVIQNASLNLKKVGPPRLILAMLGLLCGLCAGLMQALVREDKTATIAASVGPAKAIGTIGATKHLHPAHENGFHHPSIERNEHSGSYESESEDALKDDFVSSIPR